MFPDKKRRIDTEAERLYNVIVMENKKYYFNFIFFVFYAF